MSNEVIVPSSLKFTTKFFDIYKSSGMSTFSLMSESIPSTPSSYILLWVKSTVFLLNNSSRNHDSFPLYLAALLYISAP